MNLFKNAMLFTAELPAIDQMNTHLAELLFTPIGESFMSSAGFVPNRATGELVTPIAGGYSFTVRYDEKILPGSAVAQAVLEAIDALEDDRGDDLTADEREELRDKIYSDMVKKAIAKAPVYVNCFYASATNHLIIPTTSKALSQTVMRLLIQAVGSVKTSTIWVDNVKGGLTTRLQALLGAHHMPTQEEAFGNFEPGDYVVLRKEKHKAVFDVGSLEVAKKGIVEALEKGMQAESMKLRFGGVEFRLSHDFRLKQIEFTEEPTEEELEARYGDQADQAHIWRMDAGVQLLLMVAVVNELCEAFSYKPVESDKDVPKEDHRLSDAIPEKDDPLYQEALEHVRDGQRASVSGLQRNLGVGYNRAARLMERLEREGVVTEMDEYGRRQVLVKPLQVDLEDLTGKPGADE